MVAHAVDYLRQLPDVTWVTAICVVIAAAFWWGRKAAPKTVVRRPSRKKTLDPQKRRHAIGFTAMGVTGIAGLYLSLNTSIRFGEYKLGLTGDTLYTLGIVVEAIVIGLAVWSWAFNDGSAARIGYIIVIAQGVGAWEVAMHEKGDVGVFVYRMIGPFMLLYALHKLLKIEAKLGKIELRGGLLSKYFDDRKNRLEAKLGIGGRGADAENIARRNAADKYVSLNTRGKRRWWESKDHYGNAMVAAGRSALAGLEGVRREHAEAEMADRIAVEKGMRDGADHLDPIKIRGTRSGGIKLQADAAIPHDISALTSEASPAAPPGSGQAAPEPQGTAAEPQPSRNLTDMERKSFAFRIYDGLPEPSGRSFLAAWREARTADGAKLGLSDKDALALFKEMGELFHGNNESGTP